MKLPIGHKLTLSGYEVEVVSQSEMYYEVSSCSKCPFSSYLGGVCLDSCNTLTGMSVFKLIKDLRPDRRG